MARLVSHLSTSSGLCLGNNDQFDFFKVNCTVSLIHPQLTLQVAVVSIISTGMSLTQKIPADH